LVRARSSILLAINRKRRGGNQFHSADRPNGAEAVGILLAFAAAANSAGHSVSREIEVRCQAYESLDFYCRRPMNGRPAAQLTAGVSPGPTSWPASPPAGNASLGAIGPGNASMRARVSRCAVGSAL